MVLMGDMRQAELVCFGDVIRVGFNDGGYVRGEDPLNWRLQMASQAAAAESGGKRGVAATTPEVIYVYVTQENQPTEPEVIVAPEVIVEPVVTPAPVVNVEPEVVTVPETMPMLSANEPSNNSINAEDTVSEIQDTGSNYMNTSLMDEGDSVNMIISSAKADNSVHVTNNYSNDNLTSIDSSIITTGDNSVTTNVAVEAMVDVYSTFTINKYPVNLKDMLTGSKENKDVVAGSRKDDIIGFGTGAQRLMGDSGEDQFVFNKKDRFGKKGADRIIDFNPEEDRLLVSKKALKGLDKKPEFATASNSKELNSLKKEDMELVYFEPKGQLYYNQNEGGKGFGAKGGLFAILNGSPEITVESIGLLG